MSITAVLTTPNVTEGAAIAAKMTEIVALCPTAFTVGSSEIMNGTALQGVHACTDEIISILT